MLSTDLGEWAFSSDNCGWRLRGLSIGSVGARARCTGSGGAHPCTYAVPKSTKAGGSADNTTDDCLVPVLGSGSRCRVDVVLTTGHILSDGSGLFCGAVFGSGGAVHDGVESNGVRGRDIATVHWGTLVEAESVAENVQMCIVVMVVPHNFIAWWNGNVTLSSDGRITMSRNCPSNRTSNMHHLIVATGHRRGRATRFRYARQAYRSDAAAWEALLAAILPGKKAFTNADEGLTTSRCGRAATAP